MLQEKGSFCMYSWLQDNKWQSTLKELIFAGTKFRGFLGHPRNLIPAKLKNLTIREI